MKQKVIKILKNVQKLIKRLKKLEMKSNQESKLMNQITHNGQQKTSSSLFFSKPKNVRLFFVVFRWISTLDEGKFAKKYQLKPDRHLKGRKFKFVNDSDMQKDIIEGLEDIGMADEEDQNFVIRAIKQLVKNGLLFA